VPEVPPVEGEGVVIDQAAAEKALIDLAAAMRGWDPQDVAQAIFAAKQAGWDFEQRIVPFVGRLLRDGDGEPAALRHAAANPLTPVTARPADGGHWAARAREMLEHRNDDPGAIA
jgi:hypothetical protein